MVIMVTATLIFCIECFLLKKSPLPKCGREQLCINRFFCLHVIISPFYFVFFLFPSQRRNLLFCLHKFCSISNETYASARVVVSADHTTSRPKSCKKAASSKTLNIQETRAPRAWLFLLSPVRATCIRAPVVSPFLLPQQNLHGIKRHYCFSAY